MGKDEEQVSEKGKIIYNQERFMNFQNLWSDNKVMGGNRYSVFVRGENFLRKKSGLALNVIDGRKA